MSSEQSNESKKISISSKKLKDQEEILMANEKPENSEENEMFQKNSKKTKNKIIGLFKKAQLFLNDGKESILRDYKSGGGRQLIKNKFFICAASLVLILIFSPLIGGGGTPMGTDSEVKKLVLQIATQEVRNQLTPLVYQKITNIPVGLIGLKVTYEGLVNNIDKEKNAEVVKAINEAMSKLSLSLKNIRINKVDDKIKKSESSADLVVNGNIQPIDYTAQRNTDGDIYVEVFGLH